MDINEYVKNTNVCVLVHTSILNLLVSYNVRTLIY